MWQKIKKIAGSNAFVSLAGNGAGALMGIVTMALQARTLSETDFGTWIVFFTTFSLFDIIRSGLILNPVIRNMAAAPDEATKTRIAGAAWQLCIQFTFIAVVLFTLPGVIFYNWFNSFDLGFFVKWFWLLALITLPANLATWFLNASASFRKVQWIRISSQALFLAFNIANYNWHKGIDYIFWSFVISQLATTLLVLALGWSRIGDISRAGKEERKALFNFGKYSMLTLVVANLLRSSDTYIIGAVLGPAAVAIYTIPMRLMQIFEMPITSISITRLPILAGHHSHNRHNELSQEFERSAGMLWLAILPVALLCFVFAEPLVVLLGGAGYAESAIVLRFFAVYAAFLPLERYSGIGLDVVNQPRLNLIKVIIMLLVNVIGDLAALYWFADVASVAFVSVLTFGSGIVVGYWLLGRYMKFSFGGIVMGGWRTLRGIVAR